MRSDSILFANGLVVDDPASQAELDGQTDVEHHRRRATWTST